MTAVSGPTLAVSRRPPWYLMAPALACVVGVALPLTYLLIRAFEADWETVSTVVFRQRNLMLLGNTLLLCGAVLTIVTLLALPIAWLTTRTNLPGRRAFTLLAVMPLAVPAYVMAYTLLGLGGPYGTTAQLLGFELPMVRGFWGATLALSLYNLPYMFLNLRVAMQRLDPALEEAARSLGLPSWRVFIGVVMPQLRPAFLAGALLVLLHVIGDFGAVSLMRYESFSYALFMQYEAGADRVYAAWLALMLIGLTGGLLVLELRFLRGFRLDPAGITTPRPTRLVRLGWWKLPAYLLLGAVALVGLIVPLATIFFWLARHPGGVGGAMGSDWTSSLADSVSASLPAALLAALLALPIAYMARRYGSPLSRGIEQSAYLGYATPALAFALGLVFFSLRVAPWLYQTLFLLVYAYALHFLAEAVGPIRSALYVATPRLEEASRSLGWGRVQTFFRVTLPLLRSGLVVSVALVFLSAMKELPLTFILSPLGFETLAMNLWSLTNEAMFAAAAPYALTILVFSGLFVGLLLLRGHEEVS